MNQRETNAINTWIDACQATQPPATMALFLYVRDGKLFLGRGDVPLERKLFPHNDLIGSADQPKARELICKALEQAYADGPTDEVADSNG